MARKKAEKAAKRPATPKKSAAAPVVPVAKSKRRRMQLLN